MRCKICEKPYKNTGRLNNEIVESMKSAIQSESALTAALDDIYRLKKMKPLTRIVKSGKNKGEVVFNREPTLEDAEIIRRAIAEAKDEAFSGKKNIKGSLLDNFEKGDYLVFLGNIIEDSYPKHIHTPNGVINAIRAANSPKLSG